MKRMSVPAGLAILTVIAAIQLQSQRLEPAEITREKGSVTLSTRAIGKQVDGRTLSRRGIIEKFPASLPMMGAHGLSEQAEEQFTSFVEFGALEGEAAVDDLLERYGIGQSSYLPMTFAMTGWMESDLETAIEAFKGFLKTGQGLPANPFPAALFQWKGVEFHSGLV